MAIPKNIENTLRYKHLVARVQGMQPYRQEAQLKKEMVNGPQWRINAVIEGINKKPENWNYINFTDLMKHAGMYGKLQTVEKLAAVMEYKPLDRKLHPHRAAPNGVHAAFHTAARHGRYRTADLLHKFGGGPQFEAEGTVAAIYTAVEEADLRKIDYLIRRGANKDHLVHIAAGSKKYMKVTKHLVEEHGAGVNFASQGFWTPFLTSIKYERDDLTQYLLEHGATPQLDRSAGEAIYTAAGRNNAKLVGLMLELGFKADTQTLHHAIHQGAADAARVLIEKGGVAVNSGKQETLMLALVALKDGPKVVALALEKGADAKAALDALKSDPELYRYGSRDKMIAQLEAHLSPKPSQPQAPKP